MPLIMRSGTVAAGGSVANVWSGSAFEYVRSNAILSMGAKADNGLLHNINVGADVVLEEAPIPPIVQVGGNPITAYTFPIIPDDFYAQDAAAAGDRVVMSIRNPTGAGLTYYAMCIITYV